MRFLVIFLILFQLQSYAAVKKTRKNGRWSDPTVWGGKSDSFLPAKNDTLIVEHYISLDRNLELQTVFLQVKKAGTICGLYRFSMDYYSFLINEGTINVYDFSFILEGRIRNGGEAVRISNNSGTITYQNTYVNCNTTDNAKECLSGNAPTQKDVACIKYPELLFSRNQQDSCKKSCINLFIPNDLVDKNASYAWQVEDPNGINVFTGVSTSKVCYTKDTEVSVTLSSKNKAGADTINRSFIVYVSKEIAVRAMPKDTTICENSVLTITGYKPKNFVVWWLPKDGISCVNCSTTTYTPQKNVLFTQLVASVSSGSCRDSDTIDVHIIRNEPNFLRDTAICRQGVLTIAGLFGNENVVWDDGSTNSYMYVPTRGTGIYKATINNQCGIKTDSAFVKYANPLTIFIPNVFTPNGDGINDEFSILNLETYEESLLSIYNRWGEKVFDSSDKNVKWDAKNEPDGLYFYNLDRKDCNQTLTKQHGVVQIIR
jgi:gliding motility-associated-like protein